MFEQYLREWWNDKYSEEYAPTERDSEYEKYFNNLTVDELLELGDKAMEELEQKCEAAWKLEE